MTDDELDQPADGLDHYPVPFLQNLIDNGEGWQAEGALSKAVARALEDGTCVLGVAAHHDYHGRVVPARVRSGCAHQVDGATPKRNLRTTAGIVLRVDVPGPAGSLQLIGDAP